MQQRRVAGDEQPALPAAVLQGDPRLLQQRGGQLLHMPAQAGQVHGHRMEGERLPEQLQVVQQAEQPVEGLSKGGGGHRPALFRRGGAHLGQHVAQQGAQLIHQPLQLPVSEGALRGGANQDQQLPLSGGVAV